MQEGNAFCTTLEPRLFTIDMNTVEHKLFFTELISLCEAEDQLLMKLPCYKSLTSLISLRKSAMSMLNHLVDFLFGLFFYFVFCMITVNTSISPFLPSVLR